MKSDGTVWAWGQIQGGAAIYNSATDSSTPVQVQGLDHITAISAGVFHCIALKSDGTVWTWGTDWNANSHGELGDGTTNNHNAPEQVAELSGITAISAGGEHCVVRKSDGTVWSWGRNSSGQLGDGTTTDRYTPVQAVGVTLN